MGRGLTFGVGLGEVYESAATWACGLDEVASEDGNGSDKVAARRVFLNQFA